MAASIRYDRPTRHLDPPCARPFVMLLPIAVACSGTASPVPPAPGPISPSRPQPARVEPAPEVGGEPATSPPPALSGPGVGGGGRAAFCIGLPDDPFPRRCSGWGEEEACSAPVPVTVDVKPEGAIAATDLRDDLTGFVSSALRGCLLEAGPSPAGEIRFELSLAPERSRDFGPIGDGFGCAVGLRKTRDTTGSAALAKCWAAVLERSVLHLPKTGRAVVTVTLEAGRREPAATPP